jgi:hypothetical protein
MIELTREAVERAIADYRAEHLDTSQYRNWLDNKSYHSALEYEGKLYPPKRVVEMAVNRKVHGLSAKAHLEHLGYSVIPKPQQ